jgi:hypothetical protein
MKAKLRHSHFGLLSFAWSLQLRILFRIFFASFRFFFVKRKRDIPDQNRRNGLTGISTNTWHDVIVKPLAGGDKRNTLDTIYQQCKINRADNRGASHFLFLKISPICANGKNGFCVRAL